MCDHLKIYTLRIVNIFKYICAVEDVVKVLEYSAKVRFHITELFKKKYIYINKILWYSLVSICCKCYQFGMLTEYHLCRRFSPSVVFNAMKNRNPYCTEILIAFIGYLDN